MYQRENKPQLCDDQAHQRPFQAPLHTPSARWRRDPGITSLYAKTQDCRILEVYILEVYIVVYIIVCLEKYFGENRITQETVHRFALQINLLVPALQTFPPEVIPMKSGN